MNKITVPEFNIIDLKSAWVAVPIEEVWLEILFYSIDNYNDLQIRVSFDQSLFKKHSLLVSLQLYEDILNDLHSQYKELHEKFLKAIWKWYYNYLSTELPIFVYTSKDGKELEILSTEDKDFSLPLIRKNEALMARFANTVCVLFEDSNEVLNGYLLEPLQDFMLGGTIRSYAGKDIRQVKRVIPKDLMKESYVRLAREMKGVDD